MLSLRALRSLLVVVLALGATLSVASCGDNGMSKEEIERGINAASVGEENAASDQSASSLAKAQASKEADQRAADAAIRRREELDKIAKEQTAEARKVREGDVATAALSVDVVRFRSRLAGVCDGAQSRITKVSKQAEALAKVKTKDPREVLKVAQGYSDALNDFVTALRGVDPPASESAKYDRWLRTIDELANTLRLQVVSLGDKQASAKLRDQTSQLTVDFLTQTAELGVTCVAFS